MDRILLICMFVFVVFACQEPASEPKEETAVNIDPPNILLIIADDLGFSDLGCYGSAIQTPNLDKLAANGIRFNNFYTAGKGTPTRASLYTGMYGHEVGLGGGVAIFGEERPGGPFQGFLSEKAKTVAELLSPAGYINYLSGKWHIGENPTHWPMKRGFDHYFGLISGASSYFELTSDKTQARLMVKDDTPWTPPAENFYMTDAFSEQAVEYINQHQQTEKNKPFFLTLSYTAPHWPLNALESDILKYKGAFDKGWDEIRTERIAKQKKLGIIPKNIQATARPNSVPAWEDVKEKKTWTKKMEIYAAMIDRMDQGIGQVLQALEKNGIYENTLILFISDNGASAEQVEQLKLNNDKAALGTKGSFVGAGEAWANVSNAPFQKYKGWVDEGGIKVPMIVHWPEHLKEKNTIESEVVHVIDILPTILELAGVSNSNLSYLLKGKSIWPVLQGKDLEPRTLYWEFNHNKAIRDGDWKLVMGAPDFRWRLYNLKNDPNETNDLISKESERFLNLRLKHAGWSNEMGLE